MKIGSPPPSLAEMRSLRVAARDEPFFIEGKNPSAIAHAALFYRREIFGSGAPSQYANRASQAHGLEAVHVDQARKRAPFL